MANIFHTGCLHFGHENIAKHRGFASSEEHDNLLIENWNKVVNKRDKVFIHGDITMESPQHFEKLEQLNGYKHIILGNHDLPQHIPQLQKFVEKISGTIKYKDCWISHFPIHPQELSYRIHKNIHAHTHHSHILDPRYFNVDIHERGMSPVAHEIIQSTFNLFL